MSLTFQRAFCFTILIVCFGCGKETIDETHLVGSYQVKFPHGSESLLLNKDKTFVQVYTRITDGKSETNAGTWNFDLKFKDVFLTGAVLYDNRKGQISTNLEKTMWELPVIQSFDQISLSIDGDRVYEFEKIK